MNMKTSLVTAVITTYKREVNIFERALKSVLNQTYENIEIIVVDDNPCDYRKIIDIESVLSNYPNVVYLQHEYSQGACAARNTGLRHAKGDYIGFLDDDDEWCPTKIEKQIEKFDNDSVALVYCGSEYVYDTKQKTETHNTQFLRGKVYDQLILENFVGGTSFPLIRTKYLRDIDGFDILMESAQDADVWLRLALEYEVNYVEDVLVRYHVHGGDQITKDPVKKINGLERLNQKNEDYLKKNKKARYIRQIKIAPFYAQNGQKGRAFKLWLKSAFICPFKIKTNLIYLYKIVNN